MKISKSKKELARIISENGGWKEYSEWAVQDKSGEFGDKSVVLFEGEDKPVIEAGQSEWMCAEGYDSHLGKHVCNADKLVKNWHQTVLSREEYFHLYPAPDAKPEYCESVMRSIPEPSNKPTIEHDWACAPVGAMALFKRPMSGKIDYFQRQRDGSWLQYSDDIFAWVDPEYDDEWILTCDEVIHRTAIEAGIFVSDNKDARYVEPTIEQLAAYYRNAKDYADRKREEADAAKADADAKLKALELAGETIGLIVSPITEKQGPELVITNWRDLRIGDVVEGRHYERAIVGTVCDIDEHSNDNRPFRINEDGSGSWWVTSSEFKLIRRP